MRRPKGQVVALHGAVGANRESLQVKFNELAGGQFHTGYMLTNLYQQL